MWSVSNSRPSEQQDRLIGRRRFVQFAGVNLVAVSLVGTTGCATMQQTTFPRAETGPARPEMVGGAAVATLNGGARPIFIAPPGSVDPAEHSVADTLFWGEQLMEHAMFFAMLMPGPELAGPRGRAEQFQSQFREHLARLRGANLSGNGYIAFNEATLALARPLVAYKREMQEAQDSGRIHSLVWPLFFDHTAGEAERFVRRLERLNRGDISYSQAEVIPFWSDKMAEHSQFIAHLLDPEEQVLIGVSENTSDAFRRLERNPNRGGAEAAVQGIIDFKTAAAQGIESGAINSIINPALGDHVRREAIRFQDELRRSA